MSTESQMPEIAIGRNQVTDACLRASLLGTGVEVLERSSGEITAKLSPLEAGALANAYVMGAPALDPSCLEIPRS